MYKLLNELLKLIKRIFNLPEKYIEAQNENLILKRDLTNAIKYSETLESVLSKIGYDLSKISVFLENREKNEFRYYVALAQNL